MIVNATLTSIAPPAAADKFGDVAAGSATAVSVRCNLQQLTLKQKVELETIAKDLTATLYVQKSALPAGVAPAKDGRVVVTLDGGGAATTYVVVEIDNAEKAGGLSHWKCFLRRVSA